jgi:hypothetical protein
MLIKAMNDQNQDRKEQRLSSVLRFKIRDDIYYFGEFDESGELNGEAIINYSNLFLYHGQVQDGLPHGEGMISSCHGEVVFYYQGKFKQGLPNDDKGTTIINGSIYEGTWKDGVLNSKDGKLITFTIENGIPNFDVDNKVKVDKEEENTNTSSSYACGFLFNILKIFCDPLSSCMPQKAQFETLVKLPNEGEKYL